MLYRLSYAGQGPELASRRRGDNQGAAAGRGGADALIDGARVNDTAVKSDTQTVSLADAGPDGLVKLSAGRKRHAPCYVILGPSALTVIPRVAFSRASRGFLLSLRRPECTAA